MPPLHTSNASSWWERSIVKRSTPAIENLTMVMLAESTFLRQQPQAEALKLHRSQVQVGAMLGRGSFSVVSEVAVKDGLVEDGPRLEGRFAIKHLRPDLAQNPELFNAAAADLILETAYLTALNHPNILKLHAVAHGGAQAYESGMYDGYFLITDRLEGTLRDKILEWQCLQQEESLLDYFRAMEEMNDDALAPLSESLLLAEKLGMALQISSALEYMHDRRLIYRDLKPANLGITANNRIQLFDFGFCRELPSDNNELSTDDAVYFMSGKGSLMYLSPEVLYSGRYNQKVDCYSFSMVFYEMLTLNKPFHSVNNQEVFRELICSYRARPPLECAPMPLRELLQHAWAHNVSDRCTMSQIYQRLQELSSAQEAEELHAKGPMEDGPLISSPADAPLCGGGGVVFDLLLDFAKDVKLGHKILTNKKAQQMVVPTKDFQCSPTETPPLHWDETEVTENLTAVTEASSDLGQSLESNSTAETEDSTSSSLLFSSLHVNAMTATDEPLEVTWEETMSSPNDSCSSFGEDHREEEANWIMTSATHHNTAEEERCPPSPPLARTTSAPLNNNTKTTTGNNHHQPYPPQRRQSTGGKGGFSFPKSHWLPVSEFRA